MSALEFLFVISTKLSAYAGGACLLSALIALVTWIITLTLKVDAVDRDCDTTRKQAELVLKYSKQFALAALLLIPFAIMPKPEDLWNVRVSLIKITLASPENLKSGVETIERIGKKLECKYLGGCTTEGSK